MGAVVQHRGDVAAHLAQGVFPDDGEDNAGGTHILLGATIDEGIFAHIHRTGHDVRRHVRDERNRAVHIFFDLGSVDGIVRGDVEVIHVRRDGISFRDIGIILVFRAGKGIRLTQALGLFEGLVSPHTGIKVGGFVLQEIHGHIEELHGCAAAEEDHLMRVGDVQQLFPQGTAFIHHFAPLRAAVRHAHHGNTCSFEILKGRYGSVDGLLRKDAGACIEYMNFAHNRIEFLDFSKIRKIYR